MRILVNYSLREAWSVHCMADDARTPISPHVGVASESALLRLLRYVGASKEEMAEVNRDIHRWSRGSVRITLVPGRKNLLRLRQPWNAELL